MKLSVVKTYVWFLFVGLTVSAAPKLLSMSGMRSIFPIVSVQIL